MAFLTETDLYISILEDELDEITRSDAAVVQQSLIAAESEMRQWLFDTFNVDAVFSATGSNRHPLLIQYGVDIACYFLVARGQGGQYFDDRKSRYDRAINWLKAAAKTDLYSDLPRRAETEQTHIIHGSNPKRSNYF